MVIFENESIVYELKNGIVYGIWKCKYITLEIVKEIVRERLKVWGPNSYPAISYYDNLKYADHDARDFLAKKSSCEGFFMCGLVVNSIFKEKIGNFFIHFNKPEIPVRAFRTEKAAIEWIEKEGNKLKGMQWI